MRPMPNKLEQCMAASGTSIACHRNVKFPSPVYPAVDGTGHLPAKEQWFQSSYLKSLL